MVGVEFLVVCIVLLDGSSLLSCLLCIPILIHGKVGIIVSAHALNAVVILMVSVEPSSNICFHEVRAGIDLALVVAF